MANTLAYHKGTFYLICERRLEECNFDNLLTVRPGGWLRKFPVTGISTITVIA